MSVKTLHIIEVRQISPDDIRQNPDNPRLYFRSEEMASLQSSIKQYGIQVPLTVYKQGKKFILIDGERRWRCALKLNLSEVPVLVVEKPGMLRNLLLMFNIHALREQWDYVTIARKLPDVINLYNKENGKNPNETELSEITGLSRGQIRRCNFLLQLPDKYSEILYEELKLPKHKQQVSEDFFIEMEKSLKTIQIRVPDAIQELNTTRDILIEKFRNKTIGNITDFRMLSKIATSVKRLGIAREDAHRAIRIILSPNQKSIEDVYSTQFEFKYDEHKVALSAEGIIGFLEFAFDSELHVSHEVHVKLIELQDQLSTYLESLDNV